MPPTCVCHPSASETFKDSSSHSHIKIALLLSINGEIYIYRERERESKKLCDFSNAFDFINYNTSTIFILLKNNNTNYVLGIHRGPQFLASVHAIG